MKIILTLLLCSVVFAANAQYADRTFFDLNRQIEISQPISLSSDADTVNKDYKSTKDWSTYKVLNTVGWCSFGAGLTLTAYNTAALCLGASAGVGVGVWIINSLAVGGGLLLSSIPLMIIANRYKKKAKDNYLSFEINTIESTDFLGSNISSPAFNLTYSF